MTKANLKLPVIMNWLVKSKIQRQQKDQILLYIILFLEVQKVNLKLFEICHRECIFFSLTSEMIQILK